MKKIFYTLVSYLTFLSFSDLQVFADSDKKSNIKVISPTRLLPQINEKADPGQ